MGIHFQGYAPDARIVALRWRPPRAVYAELFLRQGIRYRIRSRIVRRGPSPSLDLSSAYLRHLTTLRAVLRVTPSIPQEMVDEATDRQPASEVSVSEQHHVPNTSQRDPRLIHRGDIAHQSVLHQWDRYPAQ